MPFLIVFVALLSVTGVTVVVAAVSQRQTARERGAAMARRTATQERVGLATAAGTGPIKKERGRTERALSMVTRRLIRAQEQERARIARELHDDVVQRLGLLAIGLEQFQQRYPDLAIDALQRLAELRHQTVEIASDIQSLSHELHSSKLQYLGLATAMRGFCIEFSSQHEIDVVFRAEDVPRSVHPDVSLCLFRLLQEALRNGAQHSGAKQFRVNLRRDADALQVTVADSGAGFDPETTIASRGLGLISMQERVKLVNGILTIDSHPGKGTTIHASVPLASLVTVPM